MSDDLSDLMNNLSSMLKNNEIPNEVTEFINNFSSSSSEKTSKNDLENRKNDDNKKINLNTNSENSSNINGSTNIFPDIDIGTILKLKTVMDSMKTTKDDPRANLLVSLKPYLREHKQTKVDQYVKLFGMSKLIEVINPSGSGIGDSIGSLFGFNSNSKNSGGVKNKK